MKMFSKSAEAIRYALEIIGDKTSLETLAKKVDEHYSSAYHISTANACIVRSKWRKEHGLTSDCRTNVTQFRRNMLNDNKVKLALLGKLQPILEAVGSDTFVEIIGGFHSIDQLRNAA